MSSQAVPTATPIHPLVTSNSTPPTNASGSTSRGEGVRNAGGGPPRRRKTTSATSENRKCSTYKKPPTAAISATEPVRATRASKIPLSKTATQGTSVFGWMRANVCTAPRCRVRALVFHVMYPPLLSVARLSGLFCLAQSAAQAGENSRRWHRCQPRRPNERSPHLLLAVVLLVR